MTDWLFVAMFVVAFVRGALATRKLLAIHQDEEPPRNFITFAFYVVAAVITAAAGIIGFLGTRRILGFEPIPGSAIVTVAVSGAVLFIPDFLVWTVKRIRRA